MVNGYKYNQCDFESVLLIPRLGLPNHCCQNGSMVRLLYIWNWQVVFTFRAQFPWKRFHGQPWIWILQRHTNTMMGRKFHIRRVNCLSFPVWLMAAILNLTFTFILAPMTSRLISPGCDTCSTLIVPKLWTQ